MLFELGDGCYCFSVKILLFEKMFLFNLNMWILIILEELMW